MPCKLFKFLFLFIIKERYNNLNSTLVKTTLGFISINSRNYFIICDSGSYIYL